MPKPIVNYTNRDFDSIRNDLVNYVKKYYPDTYKDFNEATFGSLMLDLVAYIGDSLSYYTDFTFNESNIDTAIKYDNIIALAKKDGYKYSPSFAAYGVGTFYILVPSLNNAPNRNYAPILKKGTKIGAKSYTLLEDVNFASTDNQVVVANVNSDTGAPTNFAIRAYGRIVSGELALFQTTVGDYKKFRRIKIPGANITEIISVFDSNGNKWYEVENLSQNTVYISLVNRASDKYIASNILKPVKVNRKFVVERDLNNVYLRFGAGASETETSLVDPAKTVLDIFGKDYISDTKLDPTSLVQTNSLGVAPENTTLTIVYRINSSSDMSVAANSLTKIVQPILEFPDRQNLSESVIESVSRTLEVTNEESINGSAAVQTTEEIKLRAKGSYSMQDRVVTREDYIAASYKMPANFGAVKRAALFQDKDSNVERNLNLFVVSETISGKEYVLTETSETTKKNLKSWLESKKMINDTVDILDAKIINFGIKFSVIKMNNSNSYSTYRSCLSALKEATKLKMDIGEPIIISDFYKALKDVSDVLDVVDVSIIQRRGINYSSNLLNLDLNLSTDARIVYCPYDSIYELKFPDNDIDGEIKG